MIEKPLAARMLYPISAMPNVFLPTSDGTRRRPAGIPAGAIENFVDQEFAQIKHVLHGISLLGRARIALTLR